MLLFIMKIDYDFIQNIFNLKIFIKNIKDKIKLSKYEDFIPMYDIYTKNIYPIKKENVHYRLINCHYRFVEKNVIHWITQLYKKYKKKEYKKNLQIISNYDIDTLIDTSYKTLYKYSPMLGLSVSICKRNSFNPYIKHLVPYYTKSELIKLGQNMDIIDQNMNLQELVNYEIHFDICKKVSFNDVSFNEILKHHNYIIKSNSIGWICFYSFFGSFLFNKFLRLELPINSHFYHGLKKIINMFQNTPILDNDYYMYRFIWDDKFLDKLNINDIFIDYGFMSTTRDPFYSPGLYGDFGLILLKIKIPKNKVGIGLFMEIFSLFPKEEEFLLTPYSKFKLISKDNNFKYYHTHPEFEKLINKKYEFEYIEYDESLLKKLEFKLQKINNLKIKIKSFNIEDIELSGTDRISLIKKFINLYSYNYQIIIKINKSKNYSFNYQWFDSSKNSSYEKLYYNKMKDGMLLSVFNNDGYPILNIELGYRMVVNFLNQYYLANVITHLNNELIEIIYNIGRIFNYNKVYIYHQYESFSIFTHNYKDCDYLFLLTNLFNNFIYKYLKYNYKYYELNPYINYEIGYWYLDSYFNKNISDDIMIKLPIKLKKIKTLKELFINTFEYEFSYYSTLIKLLDEKIFNNAFVTYNIYDRLIVENKIDNFKPNIGFNDDNIIDENYKLIFNESFRRI